MPRVKVAWHDVWIGASVTSLLFTIGMEVNATAELVKVDGRTLTFRVEAATRANSSAMARTRGSS